MEYIKIGGYPRIESIFKVIKTAESTGITRCPNKAINIKPGRLKNESSLDKTTDLPEIHLAILSISKTQIHPLSVAYSNSI
ncbi:hypothetical protein EBS43_01295, partial [bacterium]|nr:hypothetical protein [bacterium]